MINGIAGDAGRTAPPIGRRAEVERIEDLLRTPPREGRGLLISGVAGIGKSTLLRYTAERARPRFGVIEARGSRTEQSMPFAGLNQILRPLMALAPRSADGPRAALAELFGEGRAEEGQQPDSAKPAPIRTRSGDPGAIALIAAATVRLLKPAAAARPFLLLVDDAHWLDDASHRVLRTAWHALAAEPFVLIMARRPDQADPWADAGLGEMVLGPLKESEARRVLQRSATLPPGPRWERVVRMAAGNPLALVELARAWAARPDPLGGPETGDPLTARLRAGFADQLAGLPGPVRDLLLVAAVHDDERLAPIAEAWAIVTAATGDPDGPPPGASGDPAGIALAERRGILTRLAGPEGAPADSERLVFTQPLLRIAVLDSEPLARIQAAHAAVALCAGSAGRALWHRAQAIVGPDERIATELDALAATAADRADLAAAAAAAERAAELTADHGRRVVRILTAAAHCAELARQDSVDRLLRELAQAPMGLLDRARRELLTLDVGAGAGDLAAIGHLRVLALATAVAGDVALGWELLAGAALRCWRVDGGPEVCAEVAAAADRLAAIPAPVAASPRHPRRLFAVAMADPVGRCAEVLSALDDVSAEELAAAGPRAVAAWGMAARAIGDNARAAELLGRAEGELRAQGRYGGLPLISTMRAGALAAEGEFATARAVAEETLRLSELTGQPAWQIGSKAALGLAAAASGDPEAAMRIVEELLGDPAAPRRSLLHALICQIRGVALMSQGRHAEAYPLLRRVFDPDGPAHHVTGRISALGYLAEAAVHCGAAADARIVTEEMTAVYRSAPSPSLRAQILVAEAFLADEAVAADVCEAALGTPGLPPFAAARIQLVYGRCLRRNRRVAAARAPLAAAAAVFDRLGARPWADRARAESGAAGERRADRSPAEAAQDVVLEALSPQERQVALLIAQGLTNRQIGQRLNIAPRTVGSHLYRIFPKLGITSRGQLAGRLTGLIGLTGTADAADGTGGTDAADMADESGS